MIVCLKELWISQFFLDEDAKHAIEGGEHIGNVLVKCATILIDADWE